MGDILFTVHAQRQMAERKVEFDTIAEVIRKPEVVYNDRRPERAGTEVRQKGELGIVVRPYPSGDVLVITILWRHRDQWTNEQMRGRS